MATRNLNIERRGQAGVNQSKYEMIRNEVETQVQEELDPKGTNPGHHIPPLSLGKIKLCHRQNFIENYKVNYICSPVKTQSEINSNVK